MRSLIVNVFERMGSFILVLFLFIVCSTSKNGVSGMEFNVIQYNIFGRPYAVSHDGQQERLTRIPKALSDFCKRIHNISVDAITFAEADIESERMLMLEEFKKHGFAYSTSILKDTDPFTSLLNGGVLIVSRWPIEREAQHIYRGACHYSDCLAAKGVKYARINKTETQYSKIFNVFATHMQAWSTSDGRSDRVKQATQLHQFMKELMIPTSEPVIFAGDFNTDRIAYPSEVQRLVSILKASTPVQVGKQSYTSDPHSNVLVGRDGAASSDKCKTQYVESWGTAVNKTYFPTLNTRLECSHGNGLEHLRTMWSVYELLDNKCYCPCCPFEWLDYILWAKAPYEQPSKVPTVESLPVKVKPFKTEWSASSSKMKMELMDLSDHYPVLAKFEFEAKDDVKPIHLNGCTDDADCSFYAFECFCTGPHCYFDGKIINGRSYPTDHPVNRNCLYIKTHADCICGPD